MEQKRETKRERERENNNNNSKFKAIVTYEITVTSRYSTIYTSLNYEIIRTGGEALRNKEAQRARVVSNGTPFAVRFGS